jgi:glycosyltransferase involved in cell wall biosynthesis
MNNNPIKICFVSLSAYKLFDKSSKVAFGGSELQSYFLAKELSKDKNFKVYFLVNDPLGNNDLKEFNGVKVYRLKRYKRHRWRGNFLKTLFHFFLALKKIDANIYFQRAAGMETGLVAFFSKLFRKKFVYMVAHDENVLNKKFSWLPKGIRGDIYWQLSKIGIKMADFIICQHKKQKEDLKKFYHKDGIILSSVQRIPEKNEAVDLSQREFILWVARAENWKRPEIFISLVKNFPKQKFLMICPEANDKNYFEEIKNQAFKLSNLKFIESIIPFSEIENFFKKAKIFVNTSKTEGFPNTFLQAAKNKTPILSLNVNPDNILYEEIPNSKFQIPNSNDQNFFYIGFSANGNFKKLVEYTKLLLENEKLRKKLGENGYQYVKENHDIKKIIKDYKKLIFELCEKFT